MRLVRFGEKGFERPGALDAQDVIRDLSPVIGEIGADALSPAGLDRLRGIALHELPAVPSRQRIGCPVGAIGKVVGVGLNYRDHAAECELALPAEPTLFLKATSAITGPDDPLVFPRGARKVDWEVELAVVIGSAGSEIDVSDALQHVAGYAVGIDFSERDFQFNRGGQGFKGKSADSFGPLGPWLVTRDAVADPGDLTLTLSVNGTVRQRGTTAEMVFSVPYLISYISGFMSLQPGDVILTGTPAGVGMGQKPQQYLNHGDVVTAAIEGLGTQSHAVVGVPVRSIQT